MRLASTATILTFSSLALLSRALPLHPNRRIDDRILPRSATYAVVNVDGGSSAPASSPTTHVETVEATTTVVSTPPPSTLSASTAVSTLPGSTEVVTTTMVQSVSGSAATVVVTMTPNAPSPTDAPASTPPPASSVPTDATTAATTIDMVTGGIFVSADPVTVTATPSPASTSYYDDGMWHTSYAIKDFATAAASSATTTTTSSTPATTASSISTSSTQPSTSPTDSSLTVPTDAAPLNGTNFDIREAPNLWGRSKKAKHSSSAYTAASATSTAQDPPKLPTDLPKLPSTSSEAINPTEIPTIDVKEMHLVPGVD